MGGDDLSKMLFAPLGILAGILAGFIGRKLFDAAWGLVDEEEPPEPENRDVPWTKLAAALVIEGAIFRLVRGLVERGSRRGFERATGTWPGDTAPEPS
jgi:hypothetical protein